MLFRNLNAEDIVYLVGHSHSAIALAWLIIFVYQFNCFSKFLTFFVLCSLSNQCLVLQGTEEQPGLMPLAMSMILSICQTTGSTAHISYYEVYMDRCYDLLEVKAKEISILDDKDGQIHLKGLSKVPINTMSEFQEVFSSGVQRRKVAHTSLNDVSSRSHGVLVISVVSNPSDGTGSHVCGKLNLIDLAGNLPNSIGVMDLRSVWINKLIKRLLHKHLSYKC